MDGSVWIAKRRLALASTSAARRKVLAAAGFDFLVVAPDLDERGLEAQFFASGGAAGGLALHLARAKALAGGRSAPNDYCLGADQALMLGDELLHKAETRDEARARLTRLSGCSHRLRSAYAVVCGGEILFEGFDDAIMTMRALSAAQIDAYLDLVGAEAFDSVGAYKIEGLGIHLFARVEGHRSTIMGLPILPLLEGFRREGALRF